MKKLFILTIIAISLLFASCEKEEWRNGDPAMENVYYIGFENWGNLQNNVNYNVARGQTIGIPVQFHSEQVKKYDVETFYYVAGAAIRGTDYEIVDENGSVLSPDANGAFKIVWPKAVKGVKKVYVKALNGSTGSFMVQTFNPNAEVPITNANVNSTIVNKTNQYEVRAFSQNHRVRVTIQ